jgi:regulation of enolase protein 1 (concanavalin A-like superfamily)
MTVRFANGQLTLVSYQASDGWVAVVRTNKPDDIEVRFSKGGDDSRIRVRVENGQLVRVDE